jgi:hypothetical protein
MELRNNGSDRQLGEPLTCRYYQDNHEQITEISIKTGRPVREVARDLMDEACRRYLSTGGDNGEIMQKLDQLIEQNRVATERYERLVLRYEELEELNDNLKRGLIQNLREFYAILLETLSAAIGARRLTWNYIAHTVLKQSGYRDEQINERYRAEKRAWIDERERIAKLLAEGIDKMWPQRERDQGTDIDQALK